MQEITATAVSEGVTLSGVNVKGDATACGWRSGEVPKKDAEGARLLHDSCSSISQAKGRRNHSF